MSYLEPIVREEASVWDRLYQQTTSVAISKTHRIIFNCACRHLSFQGKSILQIGSGPGTFSWMAAQAGARLVTLLDQSETALERTRHLFASIQIPVNYLHTDILDPSVEIGAYDIVVSEGLLEHFKDPDLIRVLSKHRECVNRGGSVVVIVPASPHWNDIRCRAPFSRRHYGWQKPISRAKMVHFFEKAGLEIMVNERFCATYGMLHFPGCRYLNQIVEFPIESDHPLDRLFGGLLLAIGKVRKEKEEA